MWTILPLSLCIFSQSLNTGILVCLICDSSWWIALFQLAWSMRDDQIQIALALISSLRIIGVSHSKFISIYSWILHSILNRYVYIAVDSHYPESHIEVLQLKPSFLGLIGANYFDLLSSLTSILYTSDNLTFWLLLFVMPKSSTF